MLTNDRSLIRDTQNPFLSIRIQFLTQLEWIPMNRHLEWNGIGCLRNGTKPESEKQVEQRTKVHPKLGSETEKLESNFFRVLSFF